MELKKYDVPGYERKSKYGYRQWRYPWHRSADGPWLAEEPFCYYPKKAFSLILLTAVSALGIGLASSWGTRSIRTPTIFMTENDRLWVMDARGLSNHGNGFSLALPLATMETQAFLRGQGAEPFIS